MKHIKLFEGYKDWSNWERDYSHIKVDNRFLRDLANKAWIYILNNLPPNIGKSVKHYKDEGTTLFQLKLKE